MPDLEEIGQKIRNGLFEFSKHAVDQSILRKIQLNEINELFEGPELLEDYPHEK